MDKPEQGLRPYTAPQADVYEMQTPQGFLQTAMGSLELPEELEYDDDWYL